MGLIKNTVVPSSISPFSMADVESAAKQILVRARTQAEQILVAAQAEADQIKAEARIQGAEEGKANGMYDGLKEGTEAGLKQALADHKAQLQQVLTSLTAAATVLEKQRSELESRGLAEVVKLAIAIARRITKRQGILDPAVLEANLQEAMKLVVQQADLRITVNPAQRAELELALPRLALSFPALKHVELVDDEKIAPGGCRIDTRQGSIDATLDEQLDRLAQELMPDAAEARV